MLGLALGLATGLALAACGTSTTTAPRSGDRALVSLAEVTAKLTVRRFAGKPPLAVVARDGDPGAALAAVLLVDDAALGAAPGLAAVLEDRLRQHGAEARLVRGAIVLTWDASGSVKAALRAFATAATTPVSTSPALARRAADLAGPIPARGTEATVRCSGGVVLREGAAAADVAKPEGATAIEALRRATATSERVSLAVVGPQTAVDEAAQELSSGVAWAGGGPVPREASPDVGITVLDDDGPTASLRRDGDPDLMIGVELARASAAPSVARALADAADPIATRLALLGPRFAITDASGVARAGGPGSCLRLDLRAKRPDALDADAVGYAARIVREAASRAATPEEAAAPARAIVTAGDSREAAARAAWWTTTSDGAAAPSAPLFVTVTPRPGRNARVSAADAGRAVDRYASAPPRDGIERRVRHEAGQGAFVMAAGSPCAAPLDSRTLVDTAALAIGLVAVARGGDAEGVELTPFLGAEGAGLVARGEPRPGENGAALASRVARTLVTALAGPAPRVAEIERARARMVERAALEWGHPEASEALVRAVAPERPLALAPFGLEPELVRAEAAAAVAAPADVLAGPLRVAVLSNVDPAQADRAIATLAARLPPSAALPCPAAATATAPARGRIDVRVAGDERFAQLVAGMGPLSVEAAEVAVAVLEREDGELVRAAATVGGSVRARRVGGEVLLDVRVAPERTEDAFAAIQGALDRAARAEIDEPTARRVMESARARLRARGADPVRRVITLWNEGTVVDAGAPDPRSIAPRLGTASWVFVVARPS